jgi:hypothetical protein
VMLAAGHKHLFAHSERPSFWTPWTGCELEVRSVLCSLGVRWRPFSQVYRMLRMSRRMLVLAILVFASGFTHRVAWEQQ